MVFLICYKFIYLWLLPPFQSLEPLPASGPDFGALGEEAEFVEVEPEAKQEILENKDVSMVLKDWRRYWEKQPLP